MNTPSIRQARYIDFFDKLFADLQDRSPRVPWRFANHSPGRSWVAFDRVKHNIWYGVGFTRDRRLRVDLHLKDRDYDRTLALFNALRERRAAIEHALSFPIDWESPSRDSLAGRLARYIPGHIEDDPDYLEELGDWAAKTLLDLRDVLSFHFAALVD